MCLSYIYVFQLFKYNDIRMRFGNAFLVCEEYSLFLQSVQI